MKTIKVGFCSIIIMMTICTLLILNALENIEDAIREGNNKAPITYEVIIRNN